jgi:hypothetical protein
MSGLQRGQNPLDLPVLCSPCGGGVVHEGEGMAVELERELRLQAEFQMRFPIPVRMPKAVEIDVALPLDMEFVDYTWDGESHACGRIVAFVVGKIEESLHCRFLFHASHSTA